MIRHPASVAHSSWLAIVGRAVREALRKVAAFRTALAHRREVRQLAELDDWMLKDIGLVRGDVDGALSEPLFRNPSVLLVRSLERQARTQPIAVKHKAARPVVPVVTKGACCA
jgi:uncharacterized protein YjiS (DUF1127 family)